MARSRTASRAATPTQDPVELFLGGLDKSVVTAIKKQFSDDELGTAASEIRGAVNDEQKAWLKTANLLFTWKERFLAKDLSISDHFEPWAAQVTGKGVASIRTYLSGRRVALEQGISTMSKEVLQAVSMYDTETAGRILAESGGDIGKTREIKQRMKAEEAAGDPDAAAKEAVNRTNRIGKFAKTFTDQVVAAIGNIVKSGEPVDAVTAAEIYRQGFQDGAERMAPKTGLVRAGEMVAGVEKVINDLQAQAATNAEGELVKEGELPTS